MGSGQELYKKAKTMIPGGTQLLSKRPELFLPEHWPAYAAKAKGCTVKDLDGNSFIDVCYMGIGACPLGYADPDVNRAVKKVLTSGNMSTLNAPEEVELAELLLSLHPWASKVRYTRSGGEAMTVALRIARAKTEKSTVLFCGYHGWHDWYLAANLADQSALDGQLLPGLQPAGVPRPLKGSAFPFRYNDTNELHKLLNEHEDVGVIVLESIRNDDPDPEFIQTINAASKERGIVVVVDEITAGWRLNLGGAHLLYGLEPDIAVFAKAISNGIPMAAIIGKADVMEAAQTSFISSTYWTERMGPAAALATIRKMRDKHVQEHLCTIGHMVQAGWKQAAESAGAKIHIGGIAPLGHFSFEMGKPLVHKTLFTQEMLKRGWLASTAFYVSFAHTTPVVKRYLNDCETVFRQIAKAAADGSDEALLEGPVCHSGFSRLT